MGQEVNGDMKEAMEWAKKIHIKYERYSRRICQIIKRSQKFYGRYMDDWYIMNLNKKKELQDLLDNIRVIADELGIHINEKKTHILLVVFDRRV